MLNLISVVSDPLVVISETGDIKSVNEPMLELLRMSFNTASSYNVRDYVSDETFDSLIRSGIPMARTKVFRAPVELIDTQHQTHRTEARLVFLGENKDFPNCFALLLDGRSFAVRKAYGLNATEVPHRIRVRDHGAGLIIEFSAEGVIDAISDDTEIMTGCDQPAVPGQVIWDLNCWADSPEFEKEIKSCLYTLTKAEKAYMPARLNHATGETVWLELCISTTRDGRYLVEGFDVTSRVIAEMGQRQYTERLAQLSHQLIRAQESERRRIAQELHDQIGQLLTALRLGLHSVRRNVETDNIRSRVDVSMETVDKVLGHVRSLSLDLRPAMLDDLGLAAALNWFGARQSELTGLRVEVFTDHLETRLPNTIEIAGFRIVQEAVSNAMRHSQSEEIHISMRSMNQMLELVVEDFGRGFDAETAMRGSSTTGSVGLESMQQRVALVGGEFNLASMEGRGSRVRVRIPINQQI
ncbi:MAG: histidine kinase [Gammaproteobacteria bacterium]